MNSEISDLAPLARWIADRRSELERIKHEPQIDLDEFCASVMRDVDANAVGQEWRSAEARSERTGPTVVSAVLDRWLHLRGSSRRQTERLARWLVHEVGVLPYLVTLLATGLAFVAPLFVGSGRMLAAAAVLTVAGCFELIDATVAKLSSRPLQMVFVDYVADRLSDIAIFGGLGLVYRESHPTIAWVSLGVLIASLVSSYCRAQAAALRFPVRFHFGRAERLCPVIAGLWLSPVWSEAIFVAIAIAGLFTVITTFERVATVWRHDVLEELNLQVDWDPNEFLPRLLDDLVRLEGRPVALVEADAKAVGSLHGNVIALIEPGDQHGQTRVRIVRGRLRYPTREVG